MSVCVCSLCVSVLCVCMFVCMSVVYVGLCDVCVHVVCVCVCTCVCILGGCASVSVSLWVCLWCAYARVCILGVQACDVFALCVHRSSRERCWTCTWFWMTQLATATYRSGLFVVYLLGLAGTLFILTVAKETTSNHRSSTGHVCWQFQPDLSPTVSMFRAKQRVLSRFCAVVSRSCKAAGCFKVPCKAESCFKVPCKAEGCFKVPCKAEGCFKVSCKQTQFIYFFVYCCFQTCLPVQFGRILYA